jgi:hypothetical protein
LALPPLNRKKGRLKKITACEVFELVQEAVRLLPKSEPKKAIELEIPRLSSGTSSFTALSRQHVDVETIVVITF